MIAEAITKVGNEGVITVDVAAGMETEIEYTEGMEFEGGVVSTHLMTDVEKGEAEIELPFVLITDQRVENAQNLVDVMEKVVKEGNTNHMVVIADSFADGVLATLAINKEKGTFKAIPIKAPLFGPRRKQYLEDIAILTGAKVITRDLFPDWKNVTLGDLGRCERVWADKEKTQIVGGLGDKPALSSRVSQLQNEIKKEKNSFEKKKIQERLSKLTGGAAIIKVGAQTQTELDEVKERVKDAVEAVKAAIAEGYVAGGGLALREASKVLEPEIQKLPFDANYTSEEMQLSIDRHTGIQIVYGCLSRPYQKILKNAGLDEPKITSKTTLDKAISETVFDIKGIEVPDLERISTWGIDVKTGQICNFIERGIIDPVKVTKAAIKNAVSIASMVLTTDVLIAYIPEKDRLSQPL
jgi:chaperonin GroEL